MPSASISDYTDLFAAPSSTGSSDALTYTGPREILLNTPVTLTGRYNPQAIATVSVIAEDTYPLLVTLDPIAHHWQVAITKGLRSPGGRWLRLTGQDKTGQTVASQVIYLTVSDNPLSFGPLTLTILQDTLFKRDAIDSTQLGADDKVSVKAGQTLDVVRYGWVDGHLKVNLRQAIAPIGPFGYFYAGFVELKKGDQVLHFDIDAVPTTALSAQALITTPTLGKLKPVDSTALAPQHTLPLLQGQTLPIRGYACTQGHFRLTLTESLPTFGHTLYVFWPHIQIKHGNNVVPYDPDALTVAAVKGTVFKKRPVDSSQLGDREKWTFPQGQFFGVASYALEAGHIKLALTEELPGFGNTGYVFPSYVQLKRGGQALKPLPSHIELAVPYFSQRDNPRSPGSTCNVTAIAMVLSYYGVRSRTGGQLENELLQWVIHHYGRDRQTDHGILSELIRAYGFQTSFSTTRRWAEIKQELMSRRPVVLGGNFTASGHILCLIGFNTHGYIVNDPWGNALTGYINYEGRKLLYPYGYMDRVAGPDGQVWAHFIARSSG